jgi:hypothetical protein
VKAELRRFAERLLDDRVEGDGAAHEIDPNRSSVREIRCGRCECVANPPIVDPMSDAKPLAAAKR